MGLRDTILQAQPRRIPVDVKEWDCTLYVRMLTGAERLSLAAYYEEQEQLVAENKLTLLESRLNAICRMVIATACDDSGAMLFTDADMPLLKNKTPETINQIAEAAMHLNGLSEKANAELEKKSPSEPSEGLASSAGDGLANASPAVA